MGVKLSQSGYEKTPGPIYDPAPGYNLTKSRVVGSALGKSARAAPLRPQSANVGPGLYDTRGKIEGPYYG